MTALNMKGFTLIETLIYIAIIGGVVATFVTFSLTVSDARNKTYVVQEVQGNTRTALNLITQRIHAATKINTSTSVFGTDPGTLSLAMASSTLNPTIINLTADDGQLQIKEGTGSAVAITSDELKVTNLVFYDLTATSTRENVQIGMTVEFNNPSSDAEFNASQTVTTTASVRQ
jgi:type II secretory pathway pseudopilin PulG